MNKMTQRAAKDRKGNNSFGRCGLPIKPNELSTLRRLKGILHLFFFAGLLVFDVAGIPLMAQAVTGTIHGSAIDPSGAGVPGATVRATNTLTGEVHTRITDEVGDYLFPAVPVGQYRLEAEMIGFKKFVREGITLSVNRNARVDVTFEIGEFSEESRVMGDVPLVDTYQVQIGGLVDSQRVNDLPLNGRNVYDLVTILPGVSGTRLPTVQDNDGNFLTVNGSRTRHSTFMLDGGFNNELWRNSGNAAPNPDAVQEFRLLTSNFNAEYGRSPGAVINVVTKSGTNQWHGSAFEFLRNDKLNARNFFRPTVEPLRQNQFGGTFGGPILRNKTFFFASYEGLRIRSTAFRNSGLMPTVAERRGDFSTSRQPPRDPVIRTPFPGGIIPPSMLDPVALRILETFVPLPNTADGRLEVSKPTKSNSDQILAKIDYELTANHKLSGSFFLLQGSTAEPFAGVSMIPDYSPLDNTLHQRNVVVGEDWILSPMALNQFRFSYSRHFADRVGQIRTSWKDFGSQVTLGAGPPRPPQIFVTGRWNMGHFGEGPFVSQSAGWSDTLIWVRGRHALKVGTWLLYNRFDEPGNWLGSGQVRFNGGFTGNALADFLLGRAASFRQNNGTNRHFRSSSWHSFIQDDWKLHPRITLNLGLRYELDVPWISTTDEFQTFRFGQPSRAIPKAPLGLQFPGDPGIPRSVVKTDRNNWAPRLGVAIDPFGNGKTAIRAGYGIFYAIGFANFFSDLQGQPFLVDVTVFGTPNLINPYANVPGGSPFPYTLNRADPRFSLPVTASYVSENYATPYVQHYSLTLDRQLMTDLSLQVAYVGNTSRKLVVQRDANAPRFIPGGSTAGNINARRPYLPGVFAQISHTESASNAHYDSLQVSLNRRFAQKFSLLASYTLSKSIDEISDDKFNPTGVALIESNNRRLDRAPSAADTRHIFAVSYLWELPGTDRGGWLGRQVLSGWQLNGITRLQSGSPFTVVSGRDTNLDGNNNDRADLISDPKLSSNRSRDERITQYFNPGAFTTPPVGSSGNASRNLLYGPGSITWDFSLFKNITLFERRTLQFRGEFFNFLNVVNLGNPNTTLSNRNVGRILSAGPARVIQFGLKYIF